MHLMALAVLAAALPPEAFAPLGRAAMALRTTPLQQAVAARPRQPAAGRPETRPRTAWQAARLEQLRAEVDYYAARQFRDDHYAYRAARQAYERALREASR